MGCIASADGQITSKMSLAKCYLVFCGQQTPTFTYQTKSQSTFATNVTDSRTLHRNPCRAHITINDFRAESAKKVSAVFVFAGAHLHLPNQAAKHLRHTLSSFWNLLPEHRSSSITNSMEMSLKTHIRRSKEQRRKKMEKVHGRIASYRTAPRTWSTKACMQRLPEKIQLKN